jgi:hypothetical protein
MVYEEALRCGRVRGVAVPPPGFEVPDTAPCRVYVKFDNSGDAAKCKQMMDGRLFDDRKVPGGGRLLWGAWAAVFAAWGTPRRMGVWVGLLGACPGLHARTHAPHAQLHNMPVFACTRGVRPPPPNSTSQMTALDRAAPDHC